MTSSISSTYLFYLLGSHAPRRIVEVAGKNDVDDGNGSSLHLQLPHTVYLIHSGIQASHSVTFARFLMTKKENIHENPIQKKKKVQGFI